MILALIQLAYHIMKAYMFTHLKRPVTCPYGKMVRPFLIHHFKSLPCQVVEANYHFLFLPAHVIKTMPPACVKSASITRLRNSPFSFLSVVVSSLRWIFASKLRDTWFKSRPGTVSGPFIIIMWGWSPRLKTSFVLNSINEGKQMTFFPFN